MKNIFYHTIGILFACLWFTSCEQEIISENAELGEGVTLSLRLNSNNLQSRAEAGDNNYNENAITKVDLYLYPEGGSGQAKCKISKTISASASTATMTESLSSTVKEALFGSGTGSVKKCHAYALVNYNGTAPAANTDASTIAALKALEIEANFTQTQTSFVMDGESSEITYNGTNQVTGTIFVSRAASKISLFVTGVDKTVKDDAGNIWEPNLNGMDITFYNGVNKSVVDGGYSNSRPVNTLAAANIYETSGIRDITATLTETTETAYKLDTSHDPFYSYSYDWKNAADDKKPTITLMVPWRKEGDTEWKTCYYQIPVNIESKNGSLTDCFERNMYYKINLHVGILGEFDPNNPTVIPASYYTVEWKDQDVNVDIKNYKYLVVDKNDVTVYNENEVRIGYASSDAITAEITYIRRPDYSDEEVDTTRFYGALNSTSGSSSVAQGTNSLLRACTVTIENNEIVLNHNIVNQSASSGTNYDYVPYYIWLKVTMTVTVNGEKKTFTEWIRYEQYPAMYIKSNLNSDYNNDNSINGNRGYVWVNGVRDQYGSVNGMSGSASNANPNMYIITTTSLSNSTYMIGDPRTKESSDESSWSSDATSMEGVTRDLDTYYGTDYNSTFMISPKFRIASSYGVTSSITFTNARYRCASYQEDGYPAGRWRVPTRSEIEYVVRLSAEQKIPTLFNNGGNYWAADNTICVPNSANGGSVGTGNGNSAFVRCVYDEWYWTDTCNKTTFTWGDASRN